MAEVATLSVLLNLKKGQFDSGLADATKRMGKFATIAGAALVGIAALAVKSSLDQQVGINRLNQSLLNVSTSYAAQEAAIERVFMHRNADSALKLGQARGAAMIAFVEHGLDVFEYTANQVKQATVGKGHAAKQQVQHMVKILLCLQKIPQADAADALAIALCHGHSREGLLRMNGVTGIKGGRLQ